MYTTAADRELMAALRFADTTWEAETLGSVRQAFTGDPQILPNHQMDLAVHVPTNSKLRMNKVLGESILRWRSRAERRCRRAAPQHVKNRFLAVVGPPDAGKTYTLFYIV